MFNTNTTTSTTTTSNNNNPGHNQGPIKPKMPSSWYSFMDALPIL